MTGGMSRASILLLVAISVARAQEFLPGLYNPSVEGACPSLLQTTGAKALLRFSTDPGVNYATFCFAHSASCTEMDSYQIPRVMCTGPPPCAFTTRFAKLPKLKSTPGTETDYVWWMKPPMSGVWSVVAVPDTAVTNCDASYQNYCGLQTSPCSIQDSEVQDQFATKRCTGSTYRFELGSNTNPVAGNAESEWTFVAVTGNRATAFAGSCASEDNTCCYVVVQIAGAHGAPSALTTRCHNLV
jgi:hypothetical protein